MKKYTHTVIESNTTNGITNTKINELSDYGYQLIKEQYELAKHLKLNWWQKIIKFFFKNYTPSKQVCLLDVSDFIITNEKGEVVKLDNMIVNDKGYGSYKISFTQPSLCGVDLIKIDNLDKEINYPDLDNGEMLFM